LIACAFKEAFRAINASSIASAFLLLIENALAASRMIDTAITSHLNIVPQLYRADGVFHESLVFTKKKVPHGGSFVAH
jgi:hypothetical protein